MERRVLIAVFLSFLVLYGYQALFVPPPPATPETQAGGASPAPSPADRQSDRAAAGHRRAVSRP